MAHVTKTAIRLVVCGMVMTATESNRWSISSMFSTRRNLPHVPIIFNKQIMADLQGFLLRLLRCLSGHRKRQKNDMNPQFSYSGWIFEAPKSSFVTLDNSELYKANTESLYGKSHYISYWTDMERNRSPLKNFEAFYFSKDTTTNLQY